MTRLYGPNGELLPPSSTDAELEAVSTPQLRGGTLPYQTDDGAPPYAAATTGGWQFSTGDLYGATSQRYGANRALARRTCRALYLLPNPVFWGAIQLVAAFLGGDDMSYGTLDDKSAQLALDEFWQANSLGQLMTERWWIEFLLDGENATVFPTGDDDPGRDLPARVAFLDVDQAVDVQGSTARGATATDMARRLTLTTGPGRTQTWEAGQFVWTASDALWNDVRGFPIAAAAADASAGLIALYNHRLNVHDVQQRLIGIYTAFMDPEGKNAQGEADGGLYKWNRKAARFRHLPSRGGIVPLVTRPGYTAADGRTFDGVTEKLEFPRPASGASDAATDARNLVRLIGLALGGIPEHWLGEGGNATRTTASEMNTPAVRISKKRQATARGYLDRLFRTELKRRFGPDRLYTTYRYEAVIKGGQLTRRRRRVRVPADLLEVPWVLPSISNDGLQMLINRATAAAQNGWASPQALSASLGFDPALEAELMASVGLQFGQARAPTTPPGASGDPSAPDPNADPGEDT